jgi:hypothetical protein
MKRRFHLTNSLADDFLNERLPQRTQTEATLYLEECEDCRRLILSLVAGTADLIRTFSNNEKLRGYRKWMQGPETKIAGGKNVLWP